MPQGLGLNPGEDMGVCKCLVPSRHGGTLNSCRAASTLGRLLEGEERWVASDHPQGVLPQNWGGTESNRIVTCMMLKPKANDRRKNLTLHRHVFIITDNQVAQLTSTSTTTETLKTLNRKYQRQIHNQGIFYMPHNHMTCVPTNFISRKSIDSSRSRTHNLRFTMRVRYF
ncbi:cullin-4A [Trichonephila clavipes]|nr:cullin-4A [Trichonephila clavipes]